MGDIAKPSGGCADEVLGGHWPDDSESSIAAAAADELRAAKIAADASQTAGKARDYATDEMKGSAADALAGQMHVHMGELDGHAEKHLNLNGWLQIWEGGLTTCKNAMVAAVQSHQGIHDATVTGGKGPGTTQRAKDASMNAAKQAVQEARSAYDSGKASVMAGLQSAKVPPLRVQLPGSDKDKQGVLGQQSGGGDPTAGIPPVPAGTPPPAGMTPAPGANSPAAAAGAGSPAQAAAPASAAAPAAAAGPAAAAPAVSPAGMSSEAAPAASAGAGTGTGTGSGSGLGGGSPMGGMPMSGMPQMPQMQPPQMPSQTPGNDIAKTVGDTVGKLAGGGQHGQPVSAATLDKLLDAQGGGERGGEHKSETEGGPDDKNIVHKGDEKTTTTTSTGASDHRLGQYNSGGQTNTTGAAVSGPPSPAHPVVTAAPTSVSAPVTELSADENVPPAANGAGAQSVTHTSAAVPDAGDHGGQAHPPQAAPGANQNAFGLTGTQGSLQNPQVTSPGALGAYNGGGFTPMPPAPSAPMMPPAAPLAGLGAVAAGGAAPMLVPAATPSGPSTASVLASVSEPDAVVPAVPMPPEHAVAHEHLAGVLSALRNRPKLPWSSMKVAIGVFLSEEAGLPQQRLRYVLATSDGVSVVPSEVKLPMGIELLDSHTDERFDDEWGGHERPALKLITAADHFPDVLGTLQYLVSNDTADGVLAPVSCPGVTEVVQTQLQTSTLIDTGKASLGAVDRWVVSRPRIAVEQAAAALEALGRAWGFDDGAQVSVESAAARLWAARWGSGNRRLERHEDYVAVLATYWWIEGTAAVAAGRLEDAAYAATALALSPVSR